MNGGQMNFGPGREYLDEDDLIDVLHVLKQGKTQTAVLMIEGMLAGLEAGRGEIAQARKFSGNTHLTGSGD